jgi:hypothetical protein
MKTQAQSLLLLITQTGLIPLLCLAAGCSTAKQKEPPLISRGWVGGQVSVETSFPKTMIPHPKTALLVTSLATNTPASIAGLREGDLILALDHQPVKKLRQFHQKIDPLAPGTNLVVTSWRDGQIQDYNVIVGRETFHNGGMFTIVFPLIVHPFDLWLNADHPAFSLFVAGYQNNNASRVERGSVKEQYALKCDSKDTPYVEAHKLWLVLFEFSKGKRIAGQELAEAAK